MNSIVSEGCILAGGEVRGSVLGRRVYVDNGAVVEDSIVMDGCYIGPGARVRKAIVDKNARVIAKEKVGFDKDYDLEHHHVSDSGIVVVEGHRSPIPVSPVAI